jgi:hypothetical protein
MGETEHYNSVLEITVSFLEIHKWEPDIYIGFSPALHLQSWEYKNLSQIYECRNWETEHNNSVLEITVSFLGIH